MDVVEAEGDGEREPIGVAAVAAAGPDLPHPDWRLGVRDEVVELRGDEGRERGRRGGGRRGGGGGRRHRRRLMWAAMNSGGLL